MAIELSALVLREVGDAKSKPGVSDAEREVKKVGEYEVQYFKPIPAPEGAKWIRREIDLSQIVGKKTDDRLIVYGVDFSCDGGATWEHTSQSTAGDGDCLPDVGPISSQTTQCPTDDKGAQVLVRPFVGSKYPVDIGISVRFT